MKARCVVFLLASLSLLPLRGFAQSDDQAATGVQNVAGIRSEITVLAGALAEGLQLDTARGFLGINSGRVEGVYLLEQGVVFEVQSPLANQRNRLSLSALASSLRNFPVPPASPSSTNPFAAIAREADSPPPAAQQVLTRTTELAASAYQRTLDEIQSRDYPALIENAIRRADRAARMLRDLGAMEAGEQISSEQELDTIRRQAQANLERFRQLQDQADSQSAQANTDSSADQQAGQFTQELRSSLAALTTRADRMADDLDRKYEQAREAYRRNWQQDVENFELRLFELLCEFGVTLRSLPADQHLTVVLTGLGAENARARAGDRIHVMQVSQLTACEAGALDARALQQQASSYSY